MQIDLPVGSSEINQADVAAMVFVQAGEFEMGYSPGEGDHSPQHKVYLNAYWIYTHEVTNQQFSLFLNDDGVFSQEGQVFYGYFSEHSKFLNQDAGIWQPRPGYEDHPVGLVTWYGANAYCQWAGGRLPTEAEWEKAARGLTNWERPWGNDIRGDRMNFCDVSCPFERLGPFYNDQFELAAPVGSFPNGASPYGALDMAGNVWEWTADWYLSTYYENSPLENPMGPDSGTLKVARGGSYLSTEIDATSGNRMSFTPDEVAPDIGFRCVVEP